MIFNQINIHLLIVILIINISFSSSRNEESIQDIGIHNYFIYIICVYISNLYLHSTCNRFK